MSWRSIKEAPYNTYVLVSNGEYVTIGQKIEGHVIYGDCVTDLNGTPLRASHYMEIPLPPKKE